MIWTIVICIVVIDVTLIGIFPCLLKVWPPIFKYVGKQSILFSTVVYSYRTNFSKSIYDSQVAYRIHILRLNITKDWLIVRNTFFTCLPPMKISDIADYQIVKGVIGYKVHFNFKDRKIHFKVRVTNVENLREVLDGLNIIELSRYRDRE